MNEQLRHHLTSRRTFLRLATGGVIAGAVYVVTRDSHDHALDHLDPTPAPAPVAFALDANGDDPSLCPPLLEVEPAPAPQLTRSLPLPTEPRQDRRLLLPDTPWESTVSINRSAAEGPTVFVLGGVHGNEPGGWAAADQIANWMPDRGTLVVLPRANRLAIQAHQRTLPELGDLNRFYPGEPAESVGAFPMQRMASAILDLLREFEVGLLLDLHESWAFFSERTQNGTAYLGQTITNGAGLAESHRAEAIATEVNGLVTERERFTVRDRSRFAHVPDTTNRDPSWPTGGTSSLGISRFVPGVVPVLVEMGQQDQPESRRSELHQLVVRTALVHEGLLDRA
jgi:succinylglutamate desuccinylase/aspartoacylase family protein